MVSHKSLIMLFSDLLADPEPILDAIRMLRFAGHDVIIFHVLDEAEVHFPFDGMVDLRDPETQESQLVDAAAIRADYLDAWPRLRGRYRSECQPPGPTSCHSTRACGSTKRSSSTSRSGRRGF